MNQGQRESIFLIYVNVCNALIYAEDILIEKQTSRTVKDSVRPIKDKLSWIKKNMDLKVQTDVSKSIDTLRFDSICRLLSNMPEEYQQQLEDTIVKFLQSIEK